MFEDFETSIKALLAHLQKALKHKEEEDLKEFLEKHKKEHSTLLLSILPQNGDEIIFAKLKNRLLRLIFLSRAFLKDPEPFHKGREPLLDYILDDNFDQDYYYEFLRTAFLDKTIADNKAHYKTQHKTQYKTPLLILEEIPGYVYAVIETLYLTAVKLKLEYPLSRSTIMSLTSVGLLIRNTTFYAEKEFHIIRLDANIQKLGIGTKLMHKACTDIIKNPNYNALEFIAEKPALGFYIKFFQKQYDIALNDFIIQNFNDDACRIRINRDHLILCQIKMAFRAAAAQVNLLLCFSKDKENTENIHPVQSDGKGIVPKCDNEINPKDKDIKQSVKICKI